MTPVGTTPPSVVASAPLGAAMAPGGVNFKVFSRNASAVDLLFFDCADDGLPSRVIPIDPAANRSHHYWHVFVPVAAAGQMCGYRVHGPFDPARGMRFHPGKLLLDPYARGVALPTTYSRDAARLPGDNAAVAMKSVGGSHRL